MTCLQELFFRPVSSDALLQTHFFRCILPDASKLQIKSFCSWTCSIRISMNSTLIMDPVHLNKLFSISNWWILIPCYYQNLRGDFEKHPLFQHNMSILFYLVNDDICLLCETKKISNEILGMKDLGDTSFVSSFRYLKITLKISFRYHKRFISIKWKINWNNKLWVNLITERDFSVSNIAQ